MEIKPSQVDAENQGIGIDLGIKTFAVMSDGTKAKSPDYSKLERKIRSFQKKLARQPKGSKRRERTRVKIAKLHNLFRLWFPLGKTRSVYPFCTLPELWHRTR